MSIHYTQSQSVQARFWAKVEKTDGCWFWRGAQSKHGYGNFWSGSKTMSAHRASWEFAHGPILNDQNVLHRCDVRNCIRPDHLFLGTQRENLEDMHTKGRGMRGETHWTHLQPEQSLRGEYNPASKLTTDDVVEIRRRHATGNWSMYALARVFGVSDSQISHIVHNRRWKYI